MPGSCSVLLLCLTSRLQLWMRHLQSSCTTYKKPHRRGPERLSCASPALQRLGVRSRALCAVGRAPGLLLLGCLYCSAALNALLNALGGVCVSVVLWCFPICKANPAGWRPPSTRLLCVVAAHGHGVAASRRSQSPFSSLLRCQESGLAEVLGSWCWGCGSFLLLLCLLFYRPE